MIRNHIILSEIIKLLKKGYKILLVFIAGILCIIISKAMIYRTIFQYDSIAYRTLDEELGSEISEYLLARLPDSHEDITIIIEKALQVSSSHLHYKLNSKTHSVETCFLHREAHCVGYSLFFAGIMNFYIQYFHLQEEWELKHCVGQLYIGNWNIHPIFKHPSFQDHDFVTIRNIQSGEIIAVDPTLYDYSGIQTVKLRYNQ